MTEDEFTQQVLAMFPNALVSEGLRGEILIETGLRFSRSACSCATKVIAMPYERWD